MSLEDQQYNIQMKNNSVAFLFIGSSQNFENYYDRQVLIDAGISFQHSQKGQDEIQLIREDRDILRNHAHKLQSYCNIVSFESIISKRYILKKKQVIQFIEENLQKYSNYDEINIHFDGPSIKYTGDWVFKNHEILKQEELLSIIIGSNFTKNLIIVSNCNFSHQLQESYNIGRYDQLICKFNQFLFISTCSREQQFHSFYQFYNFSCQYCCFSKQLDQSHQTENKKSLQDTLNQSNLVSPFHLFSYPVNISKSHNLCMQHSLSFNDSQINTKQNQQQLQNTEFENRSKLTFYQQSPDLNKMKLNTQQITQTPQNNRNNINNNYSIDIKSSDTSNEFLSTNRTFNNNTQSFKIPLNDQVRYFISSIQPIQKVQLYN